MPSIYAGSTRLGPPPPRPAGGVGGEPSAAAGRGGGGCTQVIPVWPIFTLRLRCAQAGSDAAQPALTPAALRKPRRFIFLGIYSSASAASSELESQCKRHQPRVHR